MRLQVTLPVRVFHIGEPRATYQGARTDTDEKLQVGRPDRQLVGLRPEQPSRDADPVAEVQELEGLEGKSIRRHRHLAYVYLDWPTGPKHQEIGLPNRLPESEDAAAG